MQRDRRHRVEALIWIAILGITILIISLYIEPIGRHATISQPTQQDSVVMATPSMSPFDPNEADYKTLISAGVPRNIAVNLIRWRESGKVFRIKEDIALCYDMTDSLYFVLEPYIIIGEKYRIKPNQSNYTALEHKAHEVSKEIVYNTFRIDTATAAYLRTIGFSSRQAELVVRYGNMIGGYRNIEEFEECYAVDSAMAARLKPYIIFPEKDTTTIVAAPAITFPLEVNSADSASLIRVRGIGPKSIGHILRYRELLGGYYSVEQISELKMVTAENFQQISQQIWCDSSKIKKIYINFARHKELELHPYITDRTLKRIINHRELKGGWSTIEEMIDKNILSHDEAARIAPYLDFGTNPEE
ncbi:MAG: helix-hairpin-helix domain-containing protein [Alistipes sp.]|nr:helix-hairpin-helix domain-containing protein [Alistipes sp.]